MALERAGQVFALTWASEYVTPFSGAVEQQQGDMLNAVACRESATFFGSNIGNDILQFGFIEIAERVPRLPLQGYAPWALRVMDLHDCGNAVADTRKVLFPDTRAYGINQHPTRATANNRRNRAGSNLPEKGAPRRRFPGGSSTRGLVAVFLVRTFAPAFLPSHYSCFPPRTAE